MPKREKSYQTVIEDAEKQNIPVFVFSAKDKFLPEILKEYWNMCKDNGCAQDHLNGIMSNALDVDNWQFENKDKVKLPD